MYIKNNDVERSTPTHATLPYLLNIIILLIPDYYYLAYTRILVKYGLLKIHIIFYYGFHSGRYYYILRVLYIIYMVC